MIITDAEVEAAHRWFQENGEWVPPSLSIRAALLSASQARALSSGEGDAQVTLDLIREEVSKSNSPLGRSDSLAIDRVRSLLSARPHPPSKDNTNE